MATRGDEAAIPLSQGEVGVGEQVGQDEREGRLVLEELGAGKEKIEAIGAVVHRGIPTRGGDGVRVDVETQHPHGAQLEAGDGDRKSTRLNSSHPSISYAVFCL